MNGTLTSGEFPATARGAQTVLRVTRLLALLLCGFTLNANAEEQYWEYTVRPGDNIWNLTERYCTSVAHWKRIQRLNGIDLDRQIPPGTRLRFPLSILKHQPATALVVTVRGDARLVRAGSEDAEPLQVNTSLRSGDRIVTGPDTSVTLHFADGSELLVLGDSEIVMDSLSAWGTTGMVDTRVRLKGGRVDTRVQPSEGPGSRYQIITPAAVAAVRGTDFRVSAETAAPVMRNEVTEGTVGVQGDGVDTAVRQGFGLVTEKGKPPQKPRKLLPPPDLSGNPERLRHLPLRFDWPAVPGATAYRFQVAPDARFQTLLADRVVSGPGADWPQLADGRYVLRVRAIDVVKLEGLDAVRPFEVDARPLAPVPAAPADGSITPEASTELHWQAADGAASYHVQLSQQADFSAPLFEHTVNGPQRHWQTPALQPGTWYWRVASVDSNGARGPFDAVQNFRYRAPLPAPGPARATVTTTAVKLSWPPVANAVGYRVQVADNASYTQPVIDTQVSDAVFDTTRLPSHDYHVRVQAIDAENQRGPFSESTTFAVDPLNYWPFALSGLLLVLLLL